MTRRIHVAPEAAAELEAAARWYETKRTGLGVEFVAALDAAFDRILDLPMASPVWQAALPALPCISLHDGRAFSAPTASTGWPQGASYRLGRRSGWG